MSSSGIMLNLVSLLVAAALVSLQCGFEVNAQLESSKLELDNNLNPNQPVAALSAKRRLRQYVAISAPPPAAAPAPRDAPLALECQVYGSPAPQVAWLKNGEPVTDLEEDVNEILSIHPSSIGRMTSRLVAPARPGDEFTCVATAGLHTDTATTTVFEDQSAPLRSALLPLDVVHLARQPVITSFYNELFTEQGTTAVLPCRAAGKAQLFWTDNRDRLVYSGQSLKHRVLPSGDLMITGLRWSDMGQYSCTARNLYGKDTAATFLYPTKPSK